MRGELEDTRAMLECLRGMLEVHDEPCQTILGYYQRHLEHGSVLGIPLKRQLCQ